MHVATISEAKNQLSALIDRVQGGDAVLIVDRGTPVALLGSAVGDARPDGRVARLRRAGVLEPGEGALDESFWDEPLPELSEGASAVAAVLEERSTSY